MTNQTILKLVKQKLGISTSVRDDYLNAIIKSVIDMLDRVYHIKYTHDNLDLQMFVVDYVAYRYDNKNNNDLPRHLQWRLHNFIIQNKGGRSDVE